MQDKPRILLLDIETKPALVEATLAGAHETGRVADAAERAVGTDKKESRA